MTHTLIFVAILLLIGVLMRERVPLFRWLFIPGSVIAGFVGLAIIQLAGFAQDSYLFQWSLEASAVLSNWPGWLIAVVFAGMLMERGSITAGESLKRAARQGLMVWIIVLGQTAVGLMAVWLFIQPNYDVPNSLGMLIETGFAGGHGTAAAMGEVFAHPRIGLESGKDLGMLVATFGLVYGVLSGIFWINLGIRRKWIDPKSTTTQNRSVVSMGQSRISAETIDPLLLQVVWLALAFGVGMFLQYLVLLVAGFADQLFTVAESADAANEQLSKRLTISSIADFPLFIYTLFGGWMVRNGLERIGVVHLIDAVTINRLTATTMDILVVAAIASLNLAVVATMAVPFIILVTVGSIWAAVCLLLLARWILPKEYWFQLGLINYGMSTGTTATGFVLLKMVDAELESGAAEDYALAAPLSAPFIGGGMLTVALPLLVLERFSIAWPAILISVVVIALIVIGISSNRRANKS